MGLMFVCGEEEQKVARTTRSGKEGAQASGQDGIVDYIHRRDKKVKLGKMQGRDTLGSEGCCGGRERREG